MEKTSHAGPTKLFPHQQLAPSHQGKQIEKHGINQLERGAVKTNHCEKEYCFVHSKKPFEGQVFTGPMKLHLHAQPAH